MARSVVDFDTMFSVEYPCVLRTVSLICHDFQLAQDVTQDAFVELLRHWERVSDHDRPGAWVRRVAIRKLMRVRHREVRRRDAERAFEPLRTAEPADVDVLRALRQVPTRQRTALVLYYFEDMPIHDVAEVLGCSASTAAVHVHRGRARMGSVLEEVAHDGR
jgi:RNA polymerase sigma factor (sigma-70 family)